MFKPLSDVFIRDCDLPFTTESSVLFQVKPCGPSSECSKSLRFVVEIFSALVPACVSGFMRSAITPFLIIVFMSKVDSIDVLTGWFNSSKFARWPTAIFP